MAAVECPLGQDVAAICGDSQFSTRGWAAGASAPPVLAQVATSRTAAASARQARPRASATPTHTRPAQV